jgi:hypothetical protein
LRLSLTFFHFEGESTIFNLTVIESISKSTPALPVTTDCFPIILCNCLRAGEAVAFPVRGASVDMVVRVHARSKALATALHLGLCPLNSPRHSPVEYLRWLKPSTRSTGSGEDLYRRDVCGEEPVACVQRSFLQVLQLSFLL